MERATEKISITGKLNKFRFKTTAGSTLVSRPAIAGCRGGFTLLEMIIVCALIGIMLLVSVPNMRKSFIGNQLRASSRKVIGFINGTRQLAEREQQAYFLNIDRLESQIWYEKDISTDSKEENEDLAKLNFPAEIRISDIWTRSEGEYSDDQSRIWVSPKGYMDQTVLHLEDDDDNVVSLHFFPFLKSVKVYDQYTPVQ